MTAEQSFYLVLTFSCSSSLKHLFSFQLQKRCLAESRQLSKCVCVLMLMCYCAQVITSIPTHHLPKMLQLGAGPPPSISAAAASMGMGMAGGFTDSGSGRGQILWVRGLTRLQTQVRAAWRLRSAFWNRNEFSRGRSGV